MLSLGADVSISAAADAPARPAARQPALVALVAPHAVELSEAGIEKIIARSGNQRFAIQVLTIYGPGYFAWPQGTTPAMFEIDVGPRFTLTVRAAGYTEANHAQYVTAFDTILPQAVRLANDIRARALRPRP
jgi:hypothetical protein